MNKYVRKICKNLIETEPVLTNLINPTDKEPTSTELENWEGLKKTRSERIGQYIGTIVAGTPAPTINRQEAEEAQHTLEVFTNRLSLKAEQRGAERERQRIEGIIKKLWDKKENELHGGYDDADFLNAYELALDDILSSIKETK